MQGGISAVSLWHKVEGDGYHLSDYAKKKFKLITFVVFLFRVIKNYKSALSEKMDNVGLCAVICYLSLQASTKAVQEDM